MNQSDLDIVMSALAQQQAAQQPSSAQPSSDVEIISRALSGMQEDPGRLALPIGSNPIKQLEPSEPESSKHPLDSDWMTDSFARDFRVVTGYDPRSLVLEKGTDAERRAITPREAFHAAIATGLLKPDTQNPDPEKLQAFDSQWTAYKSDMDTNIIGAAGRGAKSNIGATIGGTAGALIGSGAGLVGSVPLSMALGAAGAYVQDVVSPPTTEDIAFRTFDNSSKITRNARLAGEILPSLATMRPTLNGPLFRLTSPAVKTAVVSTILNAGIPAATDLIKGNEFDSERFAWNAGSAVFLKPNKFGQYLFDKFARTQYAAMNVAKKLWNKFTEGEKPATIARLRASPEVSGGGIEPMSGELAGSEALVAFQQALRNKDFRMRQRQADNQRGASMAIAGALAEQPQGAGQPARRFIEQERAAQNAAALETRDRLLAEGNAQAAQIIDSAHAQAEAFNQMRDQGITSAEHALAATNRLYTEAIAAINQHEGGTTGRSQSIDSLIKARSEESKALVDDAFDRLPLGAITDFENTYKAALKVQRENKSSIAELPAIVKKILDAYAPIPTKNGFKRPKAPLKVLMNDLAELTQEISIANEANRRNDARMMKSIKDGMEVDFDSVGNMWEPVNAARQLYRRHAETFLHGTLGAETSANPTKDVTFRLDAILNGRSGTANIEAPQQLRQAINSNPDAIDTVVNHLLSKMSDISGKSSESLRKWAFSDKISRIIDAFPEATRPIEDQIIHLQDLEIQSQRNKNAIAAARGVDRAVPNENELQLARRVEQQSRMQAQQQYEIEQRLLNSNAFTAVDGHTPIRAVQAVMASNDPVQTATEIMNICRQDPSGRAVAGFQNAVREFVKNTVRRTGEVTGNVNDPSVPVGPNEFAISLKKANDALHSESELRQVMSAVLPQNELQALDAIRRQIEIIARPTRFSGGQSTTAPQGAFSEAMQGEMDKNVIGLLGRIARGWTVDRAVSTKTSRMMDNLQRFYFGQPDISPDRVPGVRSGLKSIAEEVAGWSGKDVGTRSMEMLRDSMLDPQLAADILETKIASPRARAMFRAYFISRDQLKEDAPTLPFNSMNTTETDLPNGKMIRDRSTGYMITNNGKKFAVKNHKDERVGFYNTLEEARDAAVKDWSKPTANIKLRKD